MEPSLDKIMLVDDNKSTNFFNKYLLTKWGFKGEIVVATNGAEAMEYIDSGSTTPNLIFLDLNMPVMSGFSFMKDSYVKLENTTTLILVMMGVNASTEKTEEIKSYSNTKIINQKMLTHEILDQVFSAYADRHLLINQA